MKKAGGSDTAVDLVFKKSLNDFRVNLMTTYSVAMQQVCYSTPNTLSAVTYNTILKM